MHEITCYHASGFVQNGSFPWIRTTISGSRDRRNAFIRGRNTMPCERMLPCVHMARNLFCSHLMTDECRSGRRIRTAIREYESRVIPNFTTPASGMDGDRTRLTGFQSRVSHEYFIPVRVLFSCARNAFHAIMTVSPPSTCDATLCVIIAFTGCNPTGWVQPAHDGLFPVHSSCVHVVPRSGFEPEAFCSVDRRAIQLRYQGNVRMMVPMRLAFRRPSRTQPARGGFRMLPDESECPVLHRMEQHDEYNECISDLHSLYSSWLIM